MSRTVLAVALLFSALAAGCHLRFPGSSEQDLSAHAERVESTPLEFGPGELLELETRYGSIEVLGSNDGPPELHATLRARGRTDEEAQALLARTSVVFEHGPAGPRARIEGTPLAVHDLAADDGDTHVRLSLEVAFAATVPVGTDVVARTGSGGLVLRGSLGALDLSTDFGGIRIAAAHGDVHARSGSGHIEVEHLEADEAVLESGFGSIEVQEARARHLRCQSNSGGLSIGTARVDELELDTHFGAIHVQQAGGAVRAKSGSGAIRLQDVRGAVTAESRFGALEIEGLLTELSATCGSGNLSVSALPGSRVDPSWTLASGFGRVTLSAPEDLACTLDARTSFGAVECAFPVTTTIEAGRRVSEKELLGTIGAGGGSVTLSSGSGDVVLKRQ